jgi:hypothetical protein
MHLDSPARRAHHRAAFAIADELVWPAARGAEPARLRHALAQHAVAAARRLDAPAPTAALGGAQHAAAQRVHVADQQTRCCRHGLAPHAARRVRHAQELHHRSAARAGLQGTHALAQVCGVAAGATPELVRTAPPLLAQLEAGLLAGSGRAVAAGPRRGLAGRAPVRRCRLAATMRHVVPQPPSAVASAESAQQYWLMSATRHGPTSGWLFGVFEAKSPRLPPHS